MMKKLLTTTAIATLISFSAQAGTYSASDTFNASIDFVTAVSVSISDLTINNAVSGDTIDSTQTITLTRDIDRNVSCSLDSSDLVFSAVGSDDFTISGALTLNSDTNCGTMDVAGTIPDADNGVAYSASVTLTAAYSTTTHN